MFDGHINKSSTLLLKSTLPLLTSSCTCFCFFYKFFLLLCLQLHDSYWQLLQTLCPHYVSEIENKSDQSLPLFFSIDEVIEGKKKGEMEVTRRRGRRRKKLLDDLKHRRGYSHLKEESLDRTMWRNRFGGGFGLVVRQNTEWMDSIPIFSITSRCRDEAVVKFPNSDVSSNSDFRGDTTACLFGFVGIPKWQNTPPKFHLLTASLTSSK